MKNLENYGVMEMSHSEIQETEGGSLIVFLVIAALLVTTAAY